MEVGWPKRVSEEETGESEAENFKNIWGAVRQGREQCRG